MVEKEGEWPVYKKELLTLGDPSSSTGLCTLWTEKSKVLKHINSNNYLIAGQCYNAQEGFNLILQIIEKGLTRQKKYVIKRSNSEPIVY